MEIDPQVTKWLTEASGHNSMCTKFENIMAQLKVQLNHNENKEMYAFLVFYAVDFLLRTTPRDAYKKVWDGVTEDVKQSIYNILKLEGKL